LSVRAPGRGGKRGGVEIVAYKYVGGGRIKIGPHFVNPTVGLLLIVLI